MTAPDNDVLQVTYIGDPMCSWCWGISAELLKLRDYCNENGLSFRVITGGLRPGGGEEWNEQFKTFLKEHWRHVGEMSGREFGFDLFDQNYFDYDTEPACRAIVTARSMLGEDVLGFFVDVQRKFYVENQDPKKAEFYESICEQSGINFEEFAERYNSFEMSEAVQRDFYISRLWGITGFPTVVLVRGEERIPLTSGYSAFEQMKESLDAIISRLRQAS